MVAAMRGTMYSRPPVSSNMMTTSDTVMRVTPPGGRHRGLKSISGEGGTESESKAVPAKEMKWIIRKSVLTQSLWHDSGGRLPWKHLQHEDVFHISLIRHVELFHFLHLGTEREVRHSDSGGHLGAKQAATTGRWKLTLTVYYVITLNLFLEWGEKKQTKTGRVKRIKEDHFSLSMFVTVLSSDPSDLCVMHPLFDFLACSWQSEIGRMEEKKDKIIFGLYMLSFQAHAHEMLIFVGQWWPSESICLAGRASS